MRNFKQSLILLLMSFSLVTLSSCSSDDDAGGGGQAAEGTITAKVNGTSVTTLEMVTFANLSSGTLMLQGNTGGTSSKAFNFTIIGYDGIGTYPFGGGANIFNVASYIETEVDLNDPANPTVETWNAPYDDTQVGEINISEQTETHIKGTFSFEAKDANGTMKSVTEGSFNVEIL
jgi:hypothetical protein